MKTFKCFAIFGLVAMLFQASCKKEGAEKDYRNAFTGTYAVKETTTCYGGMGDCYYEKDTTIYVTPGDTDSTINVLGRNLAINTDGHYATSHHHLQFRNDSIISFFKYGGLGGGTYVWHVGKRISKKLN